jgi:vitamin B12 transporter
VMKRLFLLLVMLLTSCMGVELKAEGSSLEELEKIVVTNRRAPAGLSAATEDITVFSREEIAQVPARNLSEVLNYIAGVDIVPRRGFGRTTSISMRGADSRQVRLMIDGIPINSQSSGQADPVDFPLENIERIEVIKGAASSLWGSALGGVINIVTKDTGTTLVPKGSVTTSFAEFGTQKESAELSGRFENLGYYFLSSYMESGGSLPRDDALERKGFAKLSYDLEGVGKITGSFGLSEADSNSGRLPDESMVSYPYRDRYGKIAWENDFDGTVLNMEFKHFRKDLVSKTFTPVEDAEPSSRIETKDRLYQLSLSSSMHPRERDLLILGLDSDYDQIKSSEYLSKARNLRLYAPYTNYTLGLEPWDFNFGLRYDYNSEFGEQVSPSLGAVYHFKDERKTLFRTTVARAFNAPPLLWKFYDTATMVSNPDIKAERAWVYEAGIESQVMPRAWLKLSLYRSDVSDAISSAESSPGIYYMKNFQKFRRQGAEFKCRLKIAEDFSFQGGAGFNDVEDRATKDTVRGGRVRQSFDAGLIYQNKEGLSLSLLGYYNRWNEFSYPDSNDRKMLCDFKALKEWQNLSLFLNIYNITNSKYWSDYYFPVPERYFEGGFSIKW